MQATDLSYFVDGDTLMIISAEKSKELNISKQNMMILPVKYTDAAEVASFLNKNVFTINNPGLSNTEIVAVNPAKNELIIFGTKSDYDMAKKVLELLDSPIRITNFKVNHVTPREMAKNICTALLKNSDDDSSNSSNDNDDNNDDNNNNNDNNNDNSSNAGDSGSNTVRLGKAKLACATGGQDSKNSGSSQQSENLYSFNQNGMKVMYYETLGTVSIIGGSQEQIDTISSFISASDVKQPMAYLEISIVELNEDGIKDFENNWQLLTQNFSITSVGGLTSIGGMPFAITNEMKGISYAVGPDSPVNWTFYNGRNNSGAKYSGPATISSYFSYLIQNKKAKTLANPKILVTSGKTSTIDLSHDYLKKMTVSQSEGTYLNRSYNPELGSDAGIIVSVTPFISRDGYVVMNLAPTYAITGEPYEGDDQQIIATPLIRRNLELSNVRVKDGETLVLGGLIQEHNSTSVGKIPILGDIPVIGFFFRDTHTQKTKEELVIMITPHIIDESNEVVNAGTNTL